MAFEGEQLSACVKAGETAGKTVLKLVVFDDLDFEFAQKVAELHPHLPVYLQPGNHTPPPADDENAQIDLDGINQRMLWLIDKVNQAHWYTAKVLPPTACYVVGQSTWRLRKREKYDRKKKTITPTSLNWVAIPNCRTTRKKRCSKRCRTHKRACNIVCALQHQNLRPFAQ